MRGASDSVLGRSTRGGQRMSTAQGMSVDIEMMKKHLEQKKRIKEKVVNLVFYLMFMGVFLTSLFLARNVGGSWEIEHAMHDAFIKESFPPVFSHVYKNYDAIGSLEEWWQWVEGPFLEAITRDHWYNGDPYTAQEDGYVYHYNRLVGGVRFRQLRVTDRSCTVSADMKKVLGNDLCYGLYTAENKDTATYRGFKHATEAETGIPGEYSRATSSYYDGGGFVVDIPQGNRTQVSAAIQDMKSRLYIDKQTRVVFVTVNIYNGNLNHLALATLMTEITPAGYMLPWWSFKIFKLEPYQDTRDYVRLGVEVILVGFLVYFVYGEYSEWREKRWGYFADPWNVIDVLNLSVFWCAVFMNVAYMINPLRSSVDLNSLQYVNLESLANDYVQIFNLQSFNVLLTFFKSFKFLQISKTMTLLWDTLGRASGDLLAFMIFFSIVFLGFASMGHVVFGPTVSSFKDFGGSFMTCFQIILGEFDYEEIHRANRVLGPMFFLVFIILVYFALVNMFLAIINDAYKIQHALLGGKTLREQLKMGLNSIWKGIKKSDASNLSDADLLKYIESSALSTKEGTLSIAELRETLGDEVPEAIAQRLLRLWNKMQANIKAEKMAKLFGGAAGSSRKGGNHSLDAMERKLQVVSEMDRREEEQMNQLDRKIEQVQRLVAK